MQLFGATKRLHVVDEISCTCVNLATRYLKPGTDMFNKILIANRGEIACRVIRTARQHGVKTVAVYSEADRNAMHVSMADESVCIGAAPVNESYLRGDAIVSAAQATGAQAIHPGYGFLSENPEFVDSVERAGLRFIGPSSDAIRAMGLKDAAKKLMQEAGVPVVPGYHGDNQDPQFLNQQARETGYPVLIKARAGGGGKGMRLVESDEQFIDSLSSAQREAEASFGDPACLIEKFITSPRHIEIQVFGDDHGNVVHLFERDCSLQRRHQKVIEEAPAPGMDESMRQAMGSAAVEAARAISYSGAGTVEFIVDSSDGLRPDRFWFMEMNTRLQVEHPVTEAITGCDLVEWQLRVAAGEPLPGTQQELTINGWAMETRIYAEDVSKGFLPATGTLHHLQFPEDARVDTGVRAGDTISSFYDPMIAKLTVHGSSRDAAVRLMAKALRNTQASGSVTNINFLSDLVEHKDFANGDVDTGLIERDSERLTAQAATPVPVLALAALQAAGIKLEKDDKSGSAFIGFALWQPLRHSIVLQDSQACVTSVSIECIETDQWRVIIDGDSCQLSILGDNRVLFGDEVIDATCVTHQAGVSVFAERAWHFSLPDPLDGSSQDDNGGDQVTAPMPGQVKLVNVAAGDKVREGDALIVMEAMKMEHTLLAPRDGEIEELLVAVGDQVQDGAVLLQLVSAITE